MDQGIDFSTHNYGYLKDDMDFLSQHGKNIKCKICKYESYAVTLCERKCSVRFERSVYIESTGYHHRNQANINETDEYGRTSLHTAVARSDFELVKELISRGADPLIKTKKGLSLLWYAVATGCVHTAEILVNHGCDVNERLPDLPHLHNAVRKNFANMVKFLLHRGADVNARINRAQTPLHVASFQDLKGKIVELLLSHGALVDAVDDRNETALFKAVISSRPKNIALLLDYGADINHRNNEMHNVIHTEMKYHYINEERLHFLIRNGADVNAVTNMNETPLHLIADNLVGVHYKCEICNDKALLVMSTSTASAHDLMDMKVLLNYGAEVNVKNVKGQTPLHLTAEVGCAYLVQQLITVGADVEAVDGNGDTPLQIAVRNRRLLAVRKLLVANADLGVVLKSGDVMASMSPEVERVIVEFLMARRFAGLSVKKVNGLLSKFKTIVVDLKMFEDKCLREVDYMRKTVLKDGKQKEASKCKCLGLKNHKRQRKSAKRKLTIFDFLRASRRALPAFFTRRVNFFHFIGKKHLALLPIYREMLAMNFVIMLRYAPILRKATDCLDALLFPYELPEIVLDLIIDKLDVDDLNNIIEANSVKRNA